MVNSVDIVVAVAVNKLVKVPVQVDVREDQWEVVARNAQAHVLSFAVKHVLSIVTSLVRMWVSRVYK